MNEQSKLNVCSIQFCDFLIMYINLFIFSVDFDLKDLLNN